MQITTKAFCTITAVSLVWELCEMAFGVNENQPGKNKYFPGYSAFGDIWVEFDFSDRVAERHFLKAVAALPETNPKRDQFTQWRDEGRLTIGQNLTKRAEYNSLDL